MLEIKSIIEQERLGRTIPALIDHQGNHWYPAEDICEILGFKNHRTAVENHLTSAQRTYAHRGKPGNIKKVLVINEAGVCRLIFKSQTSAARTLIDRITDTILPEIRKYGGYVRDWDLFNRGGE